MSVLTLPAARAAADPAIFEHIRREDCNLAIWQQRAISDFAPLLAGTPQHLRFTTTREELGALLASGLRLHRFAAAHLHDALVADVALLARHFCTALGLARFEVRLDVVTTDSCRKFHADYVRARLITTYVGPGTDWLDGKDAATVARGAEPSRINRMAPGDVGLFKGKLATMHPAIHRSPPISTTGEQRLLLVLNPVEADRDNRAI
jgi:hypothetical protein